MGGWRKSRGEAEKIKIIFWKMTFLKIFKGKIIFFYIQCCGSYLIKKKFHPLAERPGNCYCIDSASGNISYLEDPLTSIQYNAIQYNIQCFSGRSEIIWCNIQGRGCQALNSYMMPEWVGNSNLPKHPLLNWVIRTIRVLPLTRRRRLNFPVLGEPLDIVMAWSIGVRV